MNGPILIVDDEPALLSLFKRCLERAGHQITAVGDGREALERAAETNFALAVIDLALPDMDGKELIQRLLELRPALRVIIVSGLPLRRPASPETIALEKPFAPQRLVDAVAMLLAK